MRRLPALTLFAAAAAAAAATALGSCTGSEPVTPPPGNTDAGDGVDPTVAAAEGAARAGRIQPGAAEAGALFGGISAEARAGDVKIYNEHVQFVIQDSYRSHGYVDTGGNVIDADLVRTDGTLGRDTLDDLFFSFGIGRLFHADAVFVHADGADGGSAVVRAVGGDVAWDFIQGALETPIAPSEPLNLAIVTDYTLAPGSRTLGITTTLTNEGDEDALFNPTDGFLAADEDLVPWKAGAGLEASGGDDLDALGSIGRSGEACMSLWRPGDTLSPLGIAALVSSAGLTAAGHGSVTLTPGETLVLDRRVSLGPDTVTVEAERLRHEGAALGRAEGRVVDAGDGTGIAGVRVHFVDEASGPGPEGLPWIAGFAMTDSEGRFDAELPPGTWSTYAIARHNPEYIDVPAGSGRFAPFARTASNERQLAVLRGDEQAPALPFAVDRGLVEPIEVVVVDGETVAVADIALPEAASLHVVVTDGDGAPLPAYVQVTALPPEGGAPSANAPVPELLRESLGVPRDTGVVARAWSADGDLSVPVLAGSYDVLVQHGWRHDLLSIDAVTVTAGQTVQLEASLEERVPRDGWLAMDSHLHAAPSNDSSLAMEDRLITCAATGVDLPVSTDHDLLSDYRPLASALGLDNQMQVIPGLEVSPVLRGHTNAYPLEPAPLTEINGGGEPWWVIPQDTEELLGRIRDRIPETAVIQANHPRDGLFEFGVYRQDTGDAGRPDFWSWNWDAFELINSTSSRNWEIVRPDWFSFLNFGRGKVPVGVSDSHARTSPCGYGRTDLFVDTNDAASVTPAMLRDALVAGHVVVSGGLTLRVTANGGALPGDVVTGDSITLAAQLRSPAWIQPSVIRVWRNGEVIAEEALPAEPDGATWFDDSWTFESGEDAWFVVEAEGVAGQPGVWRGGLPYAAANAVLLDVAGDGWDAPGAGAR